jgi:2-polyprenyl-3-methyl-5-hydroxy-6-metoxy-1,4-benzoquinol methylase
MSTEHDLEGFLATLADKWHEVPASQLERTSTRGLASATDEDALAEWERARADTSDGRHGLNLRGWFYNVYGPWIAGKKILEVGPGLGIDGVAMARAGASMTFVDVSAANLEWVQRLFALKGLALPAALHLQRVGQLDELATDYDAVVAFGSLHHIPADIGRPEFEALARRLKPGGRFMMHAYPFQRWVDEGSLSFDRWGEKTDGAGTPWAEWYDTDKLIEQLRPAAFASVLYCEYRDGAMNCIDLIKVDGVPELEQMPAGASPIVRAIDAGAIAVQPGWKAVAAADAGGSVVVTTPEAPWAYAASVPVALNRIPAGHTRGIVRVRATVAAGRVGFGIPSRDGAAFVTEEYLTRQRHQREQECFLEFNVAADPAALMIVRNASPSVARSQVIVHSLDLFSL